MNHVRIVTRRGHMQRGGLLVPGESHTLCGGEMTDRDVPWGDAKKMAKDGNLSEWLSCPNCMKKVMA